MRKEEDENSWHGFAFVQTVRAVQTVNLNAEEWPIKPTHLSNKLFL
jgi:hypothetical protein